MSEDERVYTFFHPDGPIRLTEAELVNEYMRLREASGEGTLTAAAVGDDLTDEERFGPSEETP